MKKSLLLILFLVSSCKDDNWGGKVLDFARNEAPGIVSSLSKKDLDYKWYNYFFSSTSFGLAEINRANFIMTELEELSLDNIEKDTVKLMTVSYKLDQQIKQMYDVNASLYTAQELYDKAMVACNDSSVQNIYIENRAYLLNALQMSMPQLNFTYGATITISFGDSSSGSSKDSGGGVEAIPLIGNIYTFFSESKVKENKNKYQQAQDYINNLRIDSNELRASSVKSCNDSFDKYKDTLKMVKENLDLKKNDFKKIYTSLVKLRNVVSPIVIKNIINDFSSEDKLIYDVNADTAFTNRLMEIYTTAGLLNVLSGEKNSSFFEDVENKLDKANSLIDEMEIAKNSILGMKNAQLVTTISNVLKSKRTNLVNSVDGRLK